VSERRASAVAGIIGTVASGIAAGQNVAAPAPIEVLTCHYAEGKGPADLEGLATGFNAWMERYDAPPYTAYTLSPLSHSDEIDFDLAWVGAWPDGATMGASLVHYFTHGAELGPVFGSVMSCGTNTNYTLHTVKAPAQSAFGPLTVASCMLEAGVSIDEGLAALDEWVEHAESSGSDAAHWVLFPAYGERSDATYDFKWAQAYGSYESFGRDYDALNPKGRGRETFAALFTGVLRCDTPRSYSVRVIRAER